MGHLICKIYVSPDVLLLPLWTLLLKEVVHHDAAHAMAHLKHDWFNFKTMNIFNLLHLPLYQNYFSPFLLVAFLNQQLEFSKVFTCKNYNYAPFHLVHLPLFEIHRLYHLNILTLVDNQLTLLICCFSKVIGCSQKRRATNITSLHQTLQKGNMQYQICNMQTFQDNNFKKYDVDFQNSQPDFHFNNQHRRKFKCLWFIDYIILISFEHLWIINSPRDLKR